MKQKSQYAIPFAPVERLIKIYSTQRVSQQAVEALTEELIIRGKNISKYAWDIAQHSGRTTITKKDISIAYNQFIK
jgi:histone H3/H4